MSIRVVSLNCTHCGSPISLKNGLKTKTVVCPACGSVLGKQGAQFKVLQEQKKRASQRWHLLCIGLQGVWRDKRCEIIGSVTYYEEGCTWTEWRVLVEDGSTVWIEEEGGKYTIHQVVLPEVCPEIKTLRGATTFAYGSKEGAASYRIVERGVGRIKQISGELTWQAQLHDVVSYVSAKSPGQPSVSIEYTDSEIEFFESTRVVIDEIYQMFEMKEHIQIVTEMRKQRGKGAKLLGQWFVALTIFGMAASMLLCMYTMFSGDGRTYYREMKPITAANVTSLQETIPLEQGTAAVEVRASVTMIPPVDSISVFVTSPSGHKTHFAAFALTEPGWNTASIGPFTVPETGIYTFSVAAAAGKNSCAPEGMKHRTPSEAQSMVSLRIHEQAYAAGYWALGAFCMVLIGGLHAAVGMFFIRVMRRKGRVSFGNIEGATARLHQRVQSPEASP